MSGRPPISRGDKEGVGASLINGEAGPGLKVWCVCVGGGGGGIVYRGCPNGLCVPLRGGKAKKRRSMVGQGGYLERHLESFKAF